MYLKGSGHAFDIQVFFFNALLQFLNGIDDGGTGTDPDHLIRLDVIDNSLRRRNAVNYALFNHI